MTDKISLTQIPFNNNKDFIFNAKSNCYYDIQLALDGKLVTKNIIKENYTSSQNFSGRIMMDFEEIKFIKVFSDN